QILKELLSFSAVVVADGEAPFHSYAINVLKNASYIICCDGAIRHLVALNIVPDVIIGDGDSISKENLLKFADRFVEDKSVEYNDLAKAFNYCRQHNILKFAVLGASGLREDHTLANLSRIINYGTEFQMVMITNYGTFTPIYQSTSFLSFPGQQVSVFCFSADTPLTFSHLRYPVVNRIFEYLWEGSLNEALTDNFTIQFQKGKVLVYRAFN
ncbi:MAG: thiamine diphosphokinase, partial [Bacteroidales bacterium]|nr:thiamine diphosphokinase [Bacteroidales bacterium]